MKKIMKYRPIAALILAGSALAGCSTIESMTTDEFVQRDASARYPIQVTRAPVSLEIAANNGKLAPNQVNALVGFSHQILAQRGTPVTISMPSGSEDDVEAASEIANLLVRQGVRPAQIKRGAASGSPNIRVTYMSDKAHTAPCGDWSENVANTGSNEVMPDFGCSVQANIAAQVVNPNDFLTPAPTSPILASTRTPAFTALTTAPADSSSGSSSSSSGSSSSASP